MIARAWKWATPILSAAGVTVSAYLTYVHYQHDALVCGLGDCLVVQTSRYAELAGVPIAILGLLMYVALLGLAVLREMLPGRADAVSALLVSISLAGLAYSAWLTYIEVWVIDAICQWCVISAVIITAIFVVEAARYWAGQPLDPA